MELRDCAWTIADGVTLEYVPVLARPWSVAWPVAGFDATGLTASGRAGYANGHTAREALMAAQRDAPGRYGPALMAAAANPPRVPDRAPLAPDSPITVTITVDPPAGSVAERAALASDLCEGRVVAGSRIWMMADNVSLVRIRAGLWWVGWGLDASVTAASAVMALDHGAMVAGLRGEGNASSTMRRRAERWLRDGGPV